MTAGMSPKDVLAMIKAKKIKAVDIRFCDLFGQWQHFTLPTNMVDEASFTDGHGFDGSSIRGWKSIDESDMLVVPDATTAHVDPFFAEPTLVLIANVVDPITKEDYVRDPGCGR
jgi:glutamine synthetase